MKKLVLLTAFFLIAGLCFAQEAEESEGESDIEGLDLEITVGLPVHWTNSASPHDFNGSEYSIDKTATTSTAMGFALIFNFSSSIGLMLDMDFFFGGDVFGQSSPSSASNSIFSTNFFLGPVMYLYNQGPLRVPLGVGLSIYYWNSEVWTPNLTTGAWVKSNDVQFGPAFSLGLQFHFSESIYFFSRTTIAIDVGRYHSIAVSDGTGGPERDEHMIDFLNIGWGIKPAFGIGVKF